MEGLERTVKGVGGEVEEEALGGVDVGGAPAHQRGRPCGQRGRGCVRGSGDRGGKGGLRIRWARKRFIPR